MTNHSDKHDDLIVDPARYDLDAAWVKEASAWTRVLVRLLNCVRHQTAVIGVGAIVTVLWVVGARAQDASLVFAAIGAIVVIIGAAELIDGKTHEQDRGQGQA
jgi:hypothetical protein